MSSTAEAFGKHTISNCRAIFRSKPTHNPFFTLPAIAAAICTTLLAVTGCSSAPGTGQRVAIDTLATGVGGTAAYFGGGKDPALTTAGAVGGFVVSEGFQAIAKSGRQKAYASGLEEGKAIGQTQILQGLWEQSNGLPKSGTHQHQTLTPSAVLPARTQNGVRYDSHTPDQSERIHVPEQSNATSRHAPHYETVSTTDDQ